MKQKKPLNLNPFVLIFAVVVVAWLFTFIITPGTLVDGVYTALPKNAFNFNNVFNLFRAVPMGIKDTSNLIDIIYYINGETQSLKHPLSLQLKRSRLLTRCFQFHKCHFSVRHQDDAVRHSIHTG